MGGAPAPAAKAKERRLIKLGDSTKFKFEKQVSLRPRFVTARSALLGSLRFSRISTPSGAGDRTHGGTETRRTQTPNRTLAVLVFHFLYRTSIISHHNISRTALRVVTVLVRTNKSARPRFPHTVDQYPPSFVNVEFYESR
jgi:hypothetical protein